MADTSKDAALIQALAERLATQRLPRALDLKAKVERGETLNAFDLRDLDEVFRNARELQGLVDRHPEWHDVVVQLIGLYKEITEKGLEMSGPEKSAPDVSFALGWQREPKRCFSRRYS